MQATGVDGLAVEHAHALRVARLEPHHADPFDRMLIAQAQVESIPIITVDPAFGRYDVEVVRAA
jgi:PIN domain nuclease of toxin-antitoxin system